MWQQSKSEVDARLEGSETYLGPRGLSLAVCIGKGGVLHEWGNHAVLLHDEDLVVHDALHGLLLGCCLLTPGGLLALWVAILRAFAPIHLSIPEGRGHAKWTWHHSRDCTHNLRLNSTTDSLMYTATHGC